MVIMMRILNERLLNAERIRTQAHRVNDAVGVCHTLAQ